MDLAADVIDNMRGTLLNRVTNQMKEDKKSNDFKSVKNVSFVFDNSQSFNTKTKRETLLNIYNDQGLEDSQ